MVIEKLRYIIIGLRPKDWVKNLFVVAPLLFNRKILDLTVVVDMIWAFILFSLISGCVYLINDVIDLPFDRMHPRKKLRPLPSGKITVKESLVSATLVFVVSTTLSFMLDPMFGLIILLYFFMNVFYSISLKNIVILDVLIIAIGFVLRVQAGGIIVDGPSSSWIIMSTLFLSLFLGFAKRKGEIYVEKASKGSPGSKGKAKRNVRAVLGRYTLDMLDQFLLISATCAVMSYAIFTASEYAMEKFGTNALIYTSVFVLYGVFRYYYLVQKRIIVRSPTEILYTDYPLIINIVLWIISCVIIIGI